MSKGSRLLLIAGISIAVAIGAASASIMLTNSASDPSANNNDHATPTSGTNFTVTLKEEINFTER